MKASQDCIELLKLYEGCSLQAYKCPAGVWTIGYGHTGNVKAGDSITEAQAEALLRNDLQKYEATVNALVLPFCPLTQHRFDSLVSFVYNIGPGAFFRSTMLSYLKQKEYGKAACEFDKWIYGGGRVLPGLVKRRKAEKKLFLKTE